MNQLQTTTQSNVPAFVAEKLATLAGALEYAQMLCKSKILPAHFYEKDANGKPDFAKPKPESVVVVLQYGSEIGMSNMQAIQQLVPVNNLVSIKGDGAKALIMGSGKVQSWKEEEIGQAGTDTWGFQITCQRKDTGELSTSTFRVSDAKRAGLWIDEAAITRNAGLRHSPWSKFPRRMLRYRALGFIARDMFSDVLQGVHIEEEIDNTINVDAKVVTTETGMTIDLVKSDNTAARTTEVLTKVEEKMPKVEPAKTKTLPKETAKTESNEKDTYLAKLNQMTPVEVSEELKAKLPFDPQKLFDKGIKKSIKLAKELLLAVSEERLRDYITTTLAGIGLDLLDYHTQEEEINMESSLDDGPIEVVAATNGTLVITGPPRNTADAVAVAELFESAGIDAKTISANEGFASDEDLFRHASVEVIQKYLEANS